MNDRISTLVCDIVVQKAIIFCFVFECSVLALLLFEKKEKENYSHEIDSKELEFASASITALQPESPILFPHKLEGKINKAHK